METEWGEPEAGVQKGMFGGDVEYHPKGNGRKVQIKLDDQLKLANLKASQSQSIEEEIA